MTDDEYQRRRAFPDHDEVERLIATLRRLEESSLPPSAADFPPGWKGPYLKDGNATQALENGAHLLGKMVRWAVLHKAGIAVNQMLPGAPRYIGPPPPPRKGRVKYDDKIDSEREASDDRHEVDGESYKPGHDPVLDRQILGVLLEYYEPLFPRGLARCLRTALFALNMGQILPLLEHEGKGKHARPFDRWFLQWTALLHLEFLLGLGDSFRDDGNLRRDDATSKVAKAYGRKRTTINDWAINVPKENPGYDDFASTKADLRQEGLRARALLAQSDLSEDEKQTLERLEDDWGTAGLNRNGKKYQDLLLLEDLDE